MPRIFILGNRSRLFLRSEVKAKGMLKPNDLLHNRYLIVRQLGRGGMGTVYEAVDQQLSATVAVKSARAETDEMRRLFKDEAALLANLRHPALPRVLYNSSEVTSSQKIGQF